MGIGVMKEPFKPNREEYRFFDNSEDYDGYSGGYKNNYSGGYSGYNSNNKSAYNQSKANFEPTTGGLSKLQSFVSNNITKQKKSFDDYKVGVQVLHAKFGVGKIVKVDDMGGANYVSVDFGTLGVKTLSLNFAPLQILKK